MIKHKLLYFFILITLCYVKTTATEYHPWTIINKWNKVDNISKTYIINIAVEINQEALNDNEWTQDKSRLIQYKSLLDNIQNLEVNSGDLLIECFTFVKEYFNHKIKNERKLLLSNNLRYYSKKSSKLKISLFFEKYELYRKITNFLQQYFQKHCSKYTPNLIKKIKKLEKYINMSKMIENLINLDIKTIIERWVQIADEDRNMIRTLLFQINFQALESCIFIKTKYYSISSTNIEVYKSNNLNESNLKYFLHGFEFTMAFMVDMTSEDSVIKSRIESLGNRNIEDFLSIPYFTSCNVPKILFLVLEYLSTANTEYLDTLKPNFWCLFLNSKDGNIVGNARKRKSSIIIDNRLTNENDDKSIKHDRIQLKLSLTR